MRRIHAVELEDQSWLPARIRDHATDFLRTAIEWGDSYAAAVPLVERGMAACGTRQVVDIGSGSGGPWLRLATRVRAAGGEPQVLLTDLYPSRAARECIREQGETRLHYHPEPVDATRMNPHLRGFRTLFTALHHFRPHEARAVLSDAVRAGQGIGVFEVSERSARGIAMMLASPLLVLLLTPFIRPFRLGRLFWTYVIPVVPLVVLWDGVVSALRTYTPAEMEALARSVAPDGYRWEAGQVEGHTPVPMSYLIGWPEAPTAETAPATP